MVFGTLYPLHPFHPCKKMFNRDKGDAGDKDTGVNTEESKVMSQSLMSDSFLLSSQPLRRKAPAGPLRGENSSFPIMNECLV